ncbi:MAG: hypothetical protein ACAI35_00805 [Candidatus Methylacidiphilales bacterium]|nr:hypothetical protein [Candidatus Methylacidiphilales bacterium]
MSTPDETELKIQETLAQMEALLAEANKCIEVADEIFVEELQLTDRSVIRENILKSPDLSPDQVEAAKREFEAIDREIEYDRAQIAEHMKPKSKVVRPRRSMMRI